MDSTTTESHPLQPPPSIWFYSTKPLLLPNGQAASDGTSANTLARPLLFTPFSRSDNRLIGTSRQQEVAVRNRLYRINAARNRMFPIYWRGLEEQYLVTRAQWTLHPLASWRRRGAVTESEVMLVPEECSDQLDVLFEKHLDWLCLQADQPAERVVSLQCAEQDGEWSVVLEQGLVSEGRLLSGNGKSYLVRRVAPPADALDEPTEDGYVCPRALVLITHGIGQKLSAKLGYDFVADVAHFRELLNSNGNGSSDATIAVLPVIWRTELDAEYLLARSTASTGAESGGSAALNTFDSMLERISIPNIHGIRTVAANLMLDILFYATPAHTTRILRTTAKELNRAYNLFRRWNPEFDGPVSIMGHSLGAALVSDLLLRPAVNGEREGGLGGELNLDFKVDCVFCVGSPYAVFLLLKHCRPLGCCTSDQHGNARDSVHHHKQHVRQEAGGTLLLTSSVLFECHAWYNIFCSLDPVAHRIEPLLFDGSESSLADNPELQPAVQLPSLHALMRWKRRLSSSLESIRSALSSISLLRSSLATTADAANTVLTPTSDAADTDSRFAAFNRHGRVDFEIPASPLGISHYLSALTAHIAYWGSDELATFVRSEVLH